MDTPVDFVFYRQFWTLQRFFCDPTQCYRDGQWKVFRKCSETVVSSFKAFRLDDVADASGSGAAVATTDSNEYFAKFLTSSKLFRLQQSDSHFRRQILVQMYVNFDIGFDLFSHIFQRYTITYASCGMPYVVPMLIGC